MTRPHLGLRHGTIDDLAHLASTPTISPSAIAPAGNRTRDLALIPIPKRHVSTVTRPHLGLRHGTIDDLAHLASTPTIHTSCPNFSSYSLELSRPSPPIPSRPPPESHRDHLRATATATLRATPRATATATFATAITSGPSPFSLSCPFTPRDPEVDPHSRRDNYRDWPFTSPLTSPPSDVSPSFVIPLEKTLNLSTENSSAVLANSKVLDHFVGMGFSREMVSKVIQEYVEENEAKLLEELVTYTALESSPPPQPLIVTDPSSSGNTGSYWDDFSYTDIFSDEVIFDLVI
ncbi:hypothetical protein Fmac_001281 [Flemingia macrophylla]|uniref:Uncharacterized protein n=1 Tax=Flemingia macrophylla TaxID=520843 RepID=A0ABD1NH48_9FABA